MTDAYLIIMLRVLEYEEDELIQNLVHRLLGTQQEDGAWKLYEDDERNLRKNTRFRGLSNCYLNGNNFILTGLTIQYGNISFPIKREIAKNSRPLFSISNV